MRVAMMGAFPVFPYQDKLKIIGEVPTHTTGWNVNLAKGLAQMPDTEVHVLTLCTHIKESGVIVDEKVIIHFVKVIPRINLLTFSQYYKHKIKPKLSEINPDIVTGIGTEHIYPFLAVVSGFPFVISVHCVISDLLEHTGRKPTVRQKILTCYERYTLNKARHIIVTTPYMIKRLSSSTRGRFYVINNSVSREFFNGTMSRERDEAGLLFVGRISPEKGVSCLLKAFLLIKEYWRDPVTLKIIGDVSERSNYYLQVQDFIKRNNITEHVRFMGFRERTEVIREMKKASIVILPSLYDAFGMVLAEAMALGIPVVASNVAGIPYVVKDGETGFLVEPGNPEALAEKIMILLKDKELRRKMGQRGREEARRRFHPEVVAKKTRAVYEKVLADWREK